jgi:GR25 family glycosyltransferase involved in LPS biosynthesis
MENKLTNLNFPNMVYINIDKATERKKFMENQMKTYSATITRYRGITDNFDEYSHDWNLLLKKEDPFIADYASKYLCFQEIACLLSHLEVIRLYGNAGLVVFEDDIDLSTSTLWNFSLTDFISQLPEQIKVLQMIKFNNYNPAFIKEHVFNNSWGTGAYYVSSDLSKKIVDEYFVNGKWNISELPSKWHRKPIDAVLFSFGNAYTCTLFSWKYYVSNICEKDNDSCIGTEILEYLNTLELTSSYYFSQIRPSLIDGIDLSLSHSKNK